jgi:hypothetical protein
MIIQINGQNYQQINHEKKQSTKSKAEQKRLHEIALMGAMYTMQITNPYNQPQPTQSIDLNYVVEEYKKIANKESKLSRSKRDRIESLFNQNFNKI